MTRKERKVSRLREMKAGENTEVTTKGRALIREIENLIQWQYSPFEEPDNYRLMEAIEMAYEDFKASMQGRY